MPHNHSTNHRLSYRFCGQRVWVQLSWVSLAYSSPKQCSLDVFNSSIPATWVSKESACFSKEEQTGGRKDIQREASVYNLFSQLRPITSAMFFLVISTSTQRDGYSGLWTQGTRPIHSRLRSPNTIRWSKIETVESGRIQRLRRENKLTRLEL